VETTKPMPEDQLTAACIVTDYWGAEQGAPIKVPVSKVPGLRSGRTAYEGTLDFSGLPIEVGRYYEIHAGIPQKGGEPYRNYTSFAIEPEAAANSFKAGEIPFTSRNWDDHFPDTVEITHRIGVRIMGMRNEAWPPTPPYKTPAIPCMDLVRKYGMGVVVGVPSSLIDTRQPGWDKYDEKSLREGVRQMIQDYRKMAEPFIIFLGNEPAVKKEWIPDDVKAYKALYEEIKKTDPSVFVLGTSIGPTEEFFEGGFGKYCDAYDFHCYESPQDVTGMYPRYEKLFKKYGYPKQIWTTETGLNSGGMTRNTVAIDMVRKFTLFFAGGGVNMSWFDFFYPDPEGKGNSGDSFDTVDARYLQYAPKITGVTYYDLVNSICIKKFVEEKQYGTIHAFLFRDRDNRQLQVLWNDKGRQDVFLPLDRVKDLQVVRLDGEHRALNPAGKGVTLSIGEEPVLLLYDGTGPLAAKLGEAVATVTPPEGIVRGGSADIVVHRAPGMADEMGLVAPPSWGVTSSSNGQDAIYTVTCPKTSDVRQAAFTVTIGNEANRQGELYVRPAIIGQISARILPVAADKGKPPGVQLLVKNNGTDKQQVSWEMSLTNQLPLINGEYKAAIPVTDAHFTEVPSGQAALEGGSEQTFVIPLAAIDSQTPYRVHVQVTDASGRVTTAERYVAGFIPVPKAANPVALNGALDSPDWKRAPVEKINERRQYFSFNPKLAAWKGPQNLSANLRFLWDDKYLYAGVEVTDKYRGGLKEDVNLWQQDGLQFLIDPCRAMNESVGKYDYAMAVGKKGPQTWCYLSADGGAPPGDATDVIVSAKRKDSTSGSMTYVVAFPWSRVGPFKPSIGADLGLTMLLNNDDGKGRLSYMSWFGNASSKDIDAVGDLILSQ
jgi:hypothetical protein